MFSPVALYIVGILSGAISMVVFGSLLSSGIPGLSRWIAANAAIVAALVFLAMDGDAPTRLSVVAASGLIAAASLAVLHGSRLFFGLRASRAYESVAFVALLVGLVYWTYVAPNVDARVLLMSGFIIYVRLLVAWTVITMRPPNRPAYSYQFVASLAVLGGLVHLARAVSILSGWEHHTQFLQPTPMNVAFLALGVLTLPCLSIGAIMLAYDRMAERMERLATIDELTGALMRREFVARADANLARAKRAKPDGADATRIAIAILDIDNFKAINDNFGHAAGDRALSHFASIVAGGIRRGDLFGRLGGEEFAVLLPSTSKADAVGLIDRLRAQIAASTLAIPGGAVCCTFSAGVDELQPGDGLASLMARADAALYSAKAMGRNRVVAALSNGDQPADPINRTREPN
ncbi:GGDEF domain-containing protein [Paraburkholderia sp.]|uniref:GGDEF domain-containing protein n=1 Tax=Paraburkholderia sp. TaxID=1926495 RepID=UPI00239152BE|nr:GGDEF domain-containing protein [Paraburkholderia sp.]MDE1180199.1 GGDEF domain-containing protein [Paraburkholderia sp.]